MRQAKYRWVVIYRDGLRVNVETASGARDARLQSMWMVKERTGAWPKWGIIEVQKHPTTGNGFMYLSYRSK